MTVPVRAALLCGALLFGGGAQAVPFQLIYFPDGEPTPAQAELLSSAARFWESIVTGYAPGIDPGGPLEVDVFVGPEDGPGGFLAEAGPDFVIDAAGFTVPTVGSAFFDVDDLDAPDLFATLLHETAHVMGFGTLWRDNGVVSVIDGALGYTGAAGLAAYRTEFDLPDAAYVPLTRGQGEGSDEAHWDEDWAGGVFELMTPLADGFDYISATTVASFRDLGYMTIEPQRIDVPAPIVPLPASAWLLAGSLAGLAAMRRRS